MQSSVLGRLIRRLPTTTHFVHAPTSQSRLHQIHNAAFIRQKEGRTAIKMLPAKHFVFIVPRSMYTSDKSPHQPSLPPPPNTPPILYHPTVDPYLRLVRFDRPIGTWLLFWPCGWSIALAAAPGCLPDLHMLAVFATGAFVMRGAGCTINDMWDREIDRRVARTRERPLASGQLTQLDALVFLAAQLGIGAQVLLQLNLYSIVLGTASLGLVVVYPLMKRITYWPQLVLGAAFNYGALLGWAAVHGQVLWSACVPLYAAGVCWTIVYDTIYAHQDKVDDLAIGIKSTALRFGADTKVWLTGFSAAMIGNLTLAGLAVEQTWPYYITVGLVAAHLAQQIGSLNIDNPNDCARKFLANHRVGMLLFGGIVIGTLLREAAATGTTATEERGVVGAGGALEAMNQTATRIQQRLQDGGGTTGTLDIRP